MKILEKRKKLLRFTNIIYYYFEHRKKNVLRMIIKVSDLSRSSIVIIIYCFIETNVAMFYHNTI